VVGISSAAIKVERISKVSGEFGNSQNERIRLEMESSSEVRSKIPPRALLAPVTASACSVS